MNEKTYSTNYKVATNWCRNALILCNDIVEIDESVIENCRFSLYDEETETEHDIFQWYLTDCNQFDVEYLESHFGLLFSYSDKLGLYVLCVDHWGTGWDYVEVDTDLECAACELGKDPRK